MSSSSTAPDFERDKHVKYFVSNLRMLPNAYTETETNRSELLKSVTYAELESSFAQVRRMTLGFFCLAALELLGALETAVSEQDRKDWIEWIYAQQIWGTGSDPGIFSLSLSLAL